jgi:hypothetical protein
MLLFQLYETIDHFGVNFVHVCRRSNELSVTKLISFESRDYIKTPISAQ